ncbi:MAG TPA: hypothetical protein IAC04_07395 [Candidatus Coprenecus stercoravium]|uniref:Uncharacterized protein n=1 Tax=Candidatus Coprenecus stercoravium TaxID=2840735 RepID=A0A9D2K9U9_9BACT|nr:hypothetical protein [Candidatus Coprenecus stercoravium]
MREKVPLWKGKRQNRSDGIGEGVRYRIGKEAEWKKEVVEERGSDGVKGEMRNKKGTGSDRAKRVDAEQKRNGKRQSGKGVGRSSG